MRPIIAAAMRTVQYCTVRTLSLYLPYTYVVLPYPVDPLFAATSSFQQPPKNFGNKKATLLCITNRYLSHFSRMVRARVIFLQDSDHRMPFLLLFLLLIIILSPAQPMRIAVIREEVWRPLAVKHSERVWNILRPGLIPSGNNNLLIDTKKKKERKVMEVTDEDGGRLDPYNPIYNFMLEYYGIKGTKGCRRIARWSPPLISSLLRQNDDSSSRFSSTFIEAGSCHYLSTVNEEGEEMKEYQQLGNGVLLEDAMEEDVLQLLHLRGANLVSVQPQNRYQQPKLGVLYNPAHHYNNKDSKGDNNSVETTFKTFTFYQSILDATTKAEPIMHCHGLHEWAMQYQPVGQAPPPSAKHQSHLSLRVDRVTINAAVERRGVPCSHVDALRFFAPAARTWSQYGEYGVSVSRADQPRLEQPGCVHANMDLLKYALRIAPWVDGDVVGDALQIALEARKLDIAASPYDVSMYGLDAITVETSEGRKLYREMQGDLLRISRAVRRKILGAYNDFLLETFGICCRPEEKIERHVSKRTEDSPC